MLAGIKIFRDQKIETFKQLKGPLQGLRQFFIPENALKMMKTAFYFTLKALLVLKIFQFLS